MVLELHPGTEKQNIVTSENFVRGLRRNGVVLSIIEKKYIQTTLVSIGEIYELRIGTNLRMHGIAFWIPVL